MKKLLFILFVFISVAASGQTPHHMMHVLAGQSSGTGLKTNLVSVWEFNETSGTDAFDAHGNNDGTNVGATVNQTGVTNLTPAYDFEFNDDDKVTVPDNTDFSFTDGSGNDVAFSINVWIKPESFQANGNYMLMKRSNTGSAEEYQLYFAITTHDLMFVLFGGGTNTNDLRAVISNPFSTGEYGMLTATYDGSESENGLKLYKNGSLLSTTNTETGTYLGMSNTSSILTIGLQAFGATSRGYDGLMDQPDIWKGEELTQAKITDLWDDGNGLAYINW